MLGAGGLLVGDGRSVVLEHQPGEALEYYLGAFGTFPSVLLDQLEQSARVDHVLGDVTVDDLALHGPEGVEQHDGSREKLFHRLCQFEAAGQPTELPTFVDHHAGDEDVGPVRALPGPVECVVGDARDVDVGVIHLMPLEMAPDGLRVCSALKDDDHLGFPPVVWCVLYSTDFRFGQSRSRSVSWTTRPMISLSGTDGAIERSCKNRKSGPISPSVVPSLLGIHAWKRLLSSGIFSS